MRAHDIRHLRLCAHCGQLGDGRKMLQLSGGQWHDSCVVKTHTVSQVLRLPASERDKITIGAASVELMRKLFDARHLEVVR